MIKLNIAGVPEHFNMPWLQVLESAQPAEMGLEAAWRDYPGGSGAMLEALRSGDADVAMLLSEAAVAGEASGGYRIVSRYTDSPLIWGVHVPAASRLEGIAEIEGARFAISRFGSGSHLMACALALERGWPVDALRFVEVGGLEGAIEAFAAGGADVFLWERFMTQPQVDAGRFARIGLYSAAWPAFVVCVREAVWRDAGRELEALVRAVLTSAGELAADPAAPYLIGARYGLPEPQVAEWLATTRWASDFGLREADLSEPARVLEAAGVMVKG